jgi:ubiquinone/menaquinone biosynthesis C-methylase UbiE
MWTGAWAVNEEQQLPTYEATLRRVGLAPGDRVLDIGCGTGVFLRLCADRVAVVAGLDAAAMIEAARARVPEADLRVGDLQALPFADDAFDLVTGFASFFYADDVVAALRDAARVARPGAAVVVQVFGRPERCDLEAIKPARGRWRPEIVEELLPQAGLSVEEAFDVTWAYEYADDTALVEAMRAAGAVTLDAPAILRALAGCRRGDGSYRVANEWRVVVARTSTPAGSPKLYPAAV